MADLLIVTRRPDAVLLMVDIERVATCFIATSLAWNSNLDLNDRTPVRSVAEITDGDTRSFGWQIFLDALHSNAIADTPAMIETLADNGNDYSAYYGHFGTTLKQCRQLTFDALKPSNPDEFAKIIPKFQSVIDSWDFKDEL